jgi:hypothetical protein
MTAAGFAHRTGIVPFRGIAGGQEITDDPVGKWHLFNGIISVGQRLAGIFPPLAGTQRIHGRQVGFIGFGIKMHRFKGVVVKLDQLVRMRRDPGKRRMQPDPRHDPGVRHCLEQGLRFLAELGDCTRLQPLGIADDEIDLDAGFPEMAKIFRIQLQRIAPVRADGRHHRRIGLAIDHDRR